MKKKIKQSYLIVIGGGLLIIMLQVFMSGFFSQHIGTDDQAVDIINEVAPGYTPWATSILEFDNKYAEPLLFVLQASIGIGIIAYYFLKQRKKSL